MWRERPLEDLGKNKRIILQQFASPFFLSLTQKHLSSQASTINPFQARKPRHSISFNSAINYAVWIQMQSTYSPKYVGSLWFLSWWRIMMRKMLRALVVRAWNTLDRDDNARPPDLCTSNELSNCVSPV
jgi:hypothetical protein